MYPAGQPDITVRRVQVARGVELRVLESGSPNGRAVLLVHGWGANVYSWAETIPALASVGLRVLACDLPGHGLSDKPVDERVYSTPALCDAIVALAHACGLTRYSFVGHSLGGSLGLELAVRGEHALDRLVLISSVGLASSPLIPPLRLLSPPIVNRLTPTILRRATFAAILRVAFATRRRPTATDIDQYWAPSQFPEYAWAARACVHRARWQPQPESLLRALHLPVLVLTGRRDYLVRGTAERGRLIPTARIVSVRAGGHLVHQECARECNEQLIEFLRPGHA
ncbi:MAG TPA: alpha/beta hydrolase [Gemmatimonadaceae bacterium]|nr:alpha/beta hydrolase [Gemmatimonadaceae bacterium]